MSLNPTQAFAAIESGRLQVRHTPLGIVVETAQGTRLSSPQPTLAAAVQEAVDKLAATQARQAAERADGIVAALQRGRYFIRPRTVTGPSPDDPSITITATVFDGVVGATVSAVKGRASVAQAVIDMEALLGP